MSKRKIYITGVMSSGKTSVAKELARKFVGSLVQEPIEPAILYNTFNGTDENMKALSQYNFLLEILRHQNNKLLNNTQVFDTSLYTNLFFTRFLLGDDSYNYYKKIWNTLCDFIYNEDDYHIFLKVNYDTMIERIENRNREFEQSDSFEYNFYYQTFMDNFEDMLERNKHNERFILVKCDDKSPEEIAEQIYKEIMRIENGSI